MTDNSTTASNNTSNNTSNNSDLLLGASFGRFSEVSVTEGLSDIFGSSNSPAPNATDGGISPMNNDLPYGGNPFAGDNFWNIFAGGNNPTSGDFPDLTSSGWDLSGAATPSQTMTITDGAIADSFSDGSNSLLNTPQANTDTSSASTIWL